MSRDKNLKEIPFELPSPTPGQDPLRARSDRDKGKQFNPGAQIKQAKKTSHDTSRLKELCLRIARFVNRGGKFSYEQVDDLITGMQSGILSLQRKKQQILVHRAQRTTKKKRKNARKT